MGNVVVPQYYSTYLFNAIQEKMSWKKKVKMSY